MTEQIIEVRKFTRIGVLENGKNRQTRTFVGARRPFGDKKFEEVLPDHSSQLLLDIDAEERLKRFADGHMIHPLKEDKNAEGSK
jgi:hypothetical protein